VKASSIEEVVRILGAEKERARVLGGGTTIYELGNRGLLSDVTTLVDVSKLGLRFIRENSREGVVSIGAGTTFTDSLDGKALLRHASVAAMTEAVIAIKPVQVRNAATIGGSVCSGVPLFDLPVALLVLDATVLIQGPGGERRTPVEQFVGTFMVDLKDGEFVKSFEIASPKARTSSSFEKLSFTGDDWAIVNCATRVSVDGNGRMSDCRVAFGGGVAKIGRDGGAEKALDGKQPSKEIVRQAVEESAANIEFIADSRSSDSYRRKMARHLLGVSLGRNLERIGVGVGG
jgi:CO/xanthine dehydrogenase FAD-binding subunit